jgi:hypothetical protein
MLDAANVIAWASGGVFPLNVKEYEAFTASTVEIRTF